LTTGRLTADTCSESQVILYGIPRNVVSVLWFVVVGYTSLKVKNVRMYFMMVSALFPFIGVSAATRLECGTVERKCHTAATFALVLTEQLLGIALLPSSTAYKWDKWGLYLMAVT
jgi:hypothetical protein